MAKNSLSKRLAANFLTKMNLTIDTMNDTDAEQILKIYAEGIATGNATLETSAPDWETWSASHLTHSRLVARDGNKVVGWAALSPVSGRCVYGGVAELSVYVSEDGRGKGVGTLLLNSLVNSSEENGIWTLQAGIIPENTASIKLHLRCGFREVGRRERIGKHFGIWRDAILLERRSQIVGID